MKSALGASAVLSLLLAGCVTPDAQAPAPAAAPAAEAEAPPRNALGERVTYYAGIYDVPESLIDRSIRRESGFNPTLRRGPYWGLMQLRLDTARSVGYRGLARGLLDAAPTSNTGSLISQTPISLRAAIPTGRSRFTQAAITTKPGAKACWAS